jgi:two-component system, cell cycle sensor histidine kinase and response regulator CckA
VDLSESFHNKHGVTGILLITGLLLSIALSVAYLIYPAFISATNNRTTDAVMALARAKPSSDSIVIVDIDDNSLARYGQWPWPRFRLAQLLQTINASSPAGIGLDLILAEPDRTSPGNPGTNLNRKLDSPMNPSGSSTDFLDYDLQLADTLAKGPFILGYEFLFRNSSMPETSCGLHSPGIVRVNIPDADHDRTGFFKAQGVVCNLQLFSDAVTHSGFLNATPDADGILRRVPMLIRFDDRLYPSLVLAMLMRYQQSNQIVIQYRGIGRLDLRMENRYISVDTQGNMILQFPRRADTILRVSAGDLLDGKISSHQLNSKFVLVGSSAAGLENVYQTPTRPVHTHVGVHAQALDNLLTGQQVVRTNDFLLWEALIGLLVAMCISLSIIWFGILPSAAVCVTFVAGTWICVVLVFQAWGYLLSPLLPTVLVALNYAILTIIKTWKIQLAARERAINTLILLKSSEKNLNSIIRAVPDIIFRLDPAGRISFISPAISKYIASPDALLGQSIFDLVSPDDLPKAQYRLNEKRTGERATHGLELRMLLPHEQDGISEEAGHFSISAEGIYRGDTPSSDEFIGTQGIIRDITEQKKLEEKLLQAQKLEAIGSLAAGVAHDLNNILAGLVSYPDLLLMELPPDSPMYAQISLIQQSGQRAAAIVQDLLTLGRRGVTTGEVINLNAIILDHLASLEFNTAMKSHPNTTLESNLAPDLLNIMGSRSHLAKAIMNLLTNAAEAMPAGGKIRISSYNSYLDTSLTKYEEIPPGEYVCISVSDEGIGISSEDIRRIFEPFYSKKSMRRSGSGLGMTVIWATIKDHGGFIDLQSREGEGTRFVLYLPAIRDQTELPSQRIVLEDYIGTEQVMVVDDVPEQLQIASSMLTKLGYTVTAVASGEEAVEYLRSHTIDLMVLDMIMPGGMDGLETYARIIEIRSGQRAIIASGFSESERVKALQQMGAGVYVQKPYTLEKLGVAVRRELDR